LLRRFDEPDPEIPPDLFDALDIAISKPTGTLSVASSGADPECPEFPE